MRLFVAVNLSHEIRAAIAGALDHFPAADPPWRWTAPETWHLTLKFMGETSREQLDRAVRALETARERHIPFDVAPGRFGAFPNLRAPRVLFYEVQRGADELVALARDVDRVLVGAVGLSPEARPFHPHVTVARLKTRLSPALAARLGTVPPVVAPVHHVHSFELMESRLSRSGAQYSVVKEFALPQGPC